MMVVWDGFYQRLICSTKICLKKIFLRYSLEYKEYEATLQKAEAILNSHPLTLMLNVQTSQVCPANIFPCKENTALLLEKMRVTSSMKHELTLKYKY